MRGSIPTPGRKTVEYGGNTTCIEVVSKAGDVYIIDAGSGIRELGLDLMERYKGKVRDNYTDKKKEQRVIVVSDRISAFDVVLGTIPFKGQVLNQITKFWFEQTADVAKSHLISVPDPNIMVVRLAKPFPAEVIVRGYITGSLWREYQKGEDNYGLGLAEGMKKDQKFERPIITPSTKADEGHDMPLRREGVLELIPEEKYKKMEEMALALFKRGQEIANKRGLILVDTKYEFGETADGEIIVIDEIHTPDSSRYWILNEYEKRFSAGEEQKMLDKEFIRQWLIKEKNFMGNGPKPELSESIKVSSALRYIELYEKITGKKFEAVESDVQKRMKENLIKERLL